MNRAASRLTHPRLPVALALVAMTLVLPSLGVGLQFDDYLLRSTVRTTPNAITAIQHLFVFMDGDARHTQQRMDSGAFPWWALPEGQVAFWRPLAALTHWLDFQGWPTALALMHAQNILWFGALIFAAATLYRQLSPHTSVAGLAALLYAVDDAHGFAVGWLSNRNTLMAALFGVLTLSAHHRSRGASWRMGRFAAPLLLALGLLSAEAALATLAYLIAYAIFLESGPVLKRARSLWPYVGIIVLWRLAYQRLGFSAWGTAYIDPAREPLSYLSAVIERGPILMMAQWATPPAELYPYLNGDTARLWWWAALAGLVALTLGVMPLLRRDATARFWAVGMALSILPSAASLPANRLLFFVGLGAMGLLAHWLNARQLPAFVLRFFVGLHLILAPLSLPLTAFSPAWFGNIEPALNRLPTDNNFSAQTAIIVNAPSFFHTSYLPEVRAATGLPVPARVRNLAAGLAGTRLTRADSRTLIAQPVGGYLTGFDTVFRGNNHPLQLNQIIALAGMTVTIVELTPDQRPATVAFQFEIPLEDSSLRWFHWQAGRYVPFTPPAIGEMVTVR